MKEILDIINIKEVPKSITEINEEHLISFKSENYHTQVKFYFFLLSFQQKLEDTSNKEDLAYCYYLISYYLFIVLTPINYEEIAFNYAKKSTNLSTSIKYKEWLLIFGTLPNSFIPVYELINLAEEVISINSESTIANAILSNF